MTIYGIPREELPKALETIGPLRMTTITRDDGKWDMIMFWNEKNQAVDMMFKKRVGLLKRMLDYLRKSL